MYSVVEILQVAHHSALVDVSFPAGLSSHSTMSLFVLFSPRLADVEDNEGEGWRLYFKLYCFTDTENIAVDSVEFAFMFEQVQYLTEHAPVTEIY